MERGRWWGWKECHGSLIKLSILKNLFGLDVNIHIHIFKRVIYFDITPKLDKPVTSSFFIEVICTVEFEPYQL